jgi:hypothetical protein
MSDHFHYEYAEARHDHRGEFADERHDHDLDYAEKHHRHYDDERAVDELRRELRELREDLRDALNRIHALEDRQPDYALEQDTPQARQLQYEADLAAADLAESGYDRHGRDCQCSHCATDEDWPEERGVSEYNREKFALDRGEEP